MPKVRILIADDHALFRSGLKGLIESEAEMEVAGEATNCEEAIQKAVELNPDLLILDITMPGGGGIQIVRQILDQCPNLRILILTMHQDAAFLRAALAAGAHGYLTKSTASDAVIDAIKTIHRGDSYIDPSISLDSLHPYSPGQVPLREGEKTPPDLSRREREVLVLLAQGATNSEIAERLDIGVRSVETYRSRIANKLGLRHRTELVRYALEMGLIGPGVKSP